MTFQVARYTVIMERQIGEADGDAHGYHDGTDRGAIAQLSRELQEGYDNSGLEGFFRIIKREVLDVDDFFDGVPRQPTPDYDDGAFGGNGFYLVTYGGNPSPLGPFATVNEMAVATNLRSYPSNGYVVWVEDGSPSSVPSLNPDDLVKTPVAVTYTFVVDVNDPEDGNDVASAVEEYIHSTSGVLDNPIRVEQV